MSTERNRRDGVSPGDRDFRELPSDAAHTFDQTNNQVDGLQGDADDPEKVAERLDGEEAEPPAVVAPPTGGSPQGIIPPERTVAGRRERRQGSEPSDAKDPDA